MISSSCLLLHMSLAPLAFRSCDFRVPQVRTRLYFLMARIDSGDGEQRLDTWNHQISWELRWYCLCTLEGKD